MFSEGRIWGFYCKAGLDCIQLGRDFLQLPEGVN
jgi:hypothetical protein